MVASDAGCMHRVRLKIDTIAGTAEVPVDRILTLAPGDTLRLEPSTEYPIRVLVDGMPKFYAKPGLSGRSRAVQIVGVATED
jgi:flagellar motor switch protein FliM